MLTERSAEAKSQLAQGEPTAPPNPSLKLRVQSAPPPIPEHKKAFFVLPENRGAWESYHQGLQTLLPFESDLHRIFGDLYAEEGGRAVDLKTQAVGGFLSSTLADMYARGRLVDLPPDLRPADLTPEQQAYAYRQYFEDVLHTVGGTMALAQLGDAEAAYALAETMLWDGRRSGPRQIQEAINDTARQIGSEIQVAVDGEMGPQTLAAYHALLGRDGARDAVLHALADIRRRNRTPSEQQRTDRTRPKQPML